MSHGIPAFRPVVVALFAVTTCSAAGAAPRAHDIHLTHTRMVVEHTKITARVRIFRDDLQTVLQRHSGRPSLQVSPATPQDSLFRAYFMSKVVVSAGGRRLQARVIRSGPDLDATDAPMWWYLVELRATRPITSLGLRYELMYDMFDDQRNVLTVVKMPSADRYSLYFAAGDSKEQTLRF